VPGLMDTPLTPPPERSVPAAPLSLEAIGEILLDSALEALVLAFMVLVMGKVVLGLVSGLFHDMIPSAPPLMATNPEAGTAASHAWSAVRDALQRHQWAIVFGFIFVGKAAGGLAGYARNQQHRNALAWVKRVGRRVSQEWFDLVVANAFTALIGAIVIRWAGNFSFNQFLWQMFVDALKPALIALAGLFPAGLEHFVSAWVTWFSDNQFRFTFWVLYSAAICDDLGLPNYKTLGRWLRRRVFSPLRRYPCCPPGPQEE
jgi:hypothetical protein